MARHIRRTVALLAIGWALGHGTASAATPACPPLPQTVLTPAVVQEATQHPQDRGFLWRIEKDGHASWLYGTLHLGRAPWVVPGPKTSSALQQSDTLALELDVLDSESLQPLMSSGDPQRRVKVMTPERSKRLAALRKAACVDGPDNGIQKLSPILQATTLAGLSARADGLYADFGADVILAVTARKALVPVVALETASRQYAALVPATTREEGEMLDQFMQQLESGEMRSQMLELARLWSDSNLQRLSSYEQWCDCLNTALEKAQWKSLLDERNPHLADGIAAQHEKGRRVFAAVGALHMVGPNGLVNLLGQRGFAVTQVLPAR
ncbi:TraB/GumN family protein [Variovorax dokdonensis]|uniref:TraB/GumN family protein n=1 Tax=Variovorax dokdonensis TaxID=344883 RepID=A0ABT7NG71_9BURK|nr:TraB/GumN family protein [Variovorax dokdonensis]MDM0046951.1 TraB/GumN family protein [Variovorax dokdonensis]